jgi:DNA-binding transcriptional LysR family regulator
MNLAPTDWTLVAAFLAVCRTGSLSAAARRLHLSQPTVRRHVEELEGRLGAALFTRGPAGLQPTPTADLLVPHAEAMEAAAGAFARTAAGDAGQVRGPVRLTCSEVHGTEVLPRLLAPLLAACPGLVIELVPSNATQNLLRRDADLALRFAEPAQDALLARKVAPVPLGLFAAPALVERHGLPQDYGDFARRWPAVWDDRRDLLARGYAALGLVPPANIVLRTDSDLAQLAAIRAGVGAGIAQVQLAQGLVRLLPDLAPAMPAWVVMHEDLRRVARVRAVFDHLVQALA